jgi:SUKH superfamily protein
VHWLLKFQLLAPNQRFDLPLKGKVPLVPSTDMTQEDFDNLIKEIREEDPDQLSSEFLVREEPLSEEKLAKFEQKAGFQFPEEYRYFLKKFGAGEIGTVTILSPDPESQFSMWDGKEEFNRETGFPFAEDSDGIFYAFLVENGVCSKDVWAAEQGASGDLSYTDYEDFFEFVAEVGFGVDL